MAADIFSRADVREASDAASEAGSSLDKARRLSRLAQRAFQLVHQGLGKPIRDPRDPKSFDANTIFPELPSFRSIARAYSKDMYALFADGQPNAAVQRGLEALRFSQQIDGFTLIQMLVSVSMQSIVLAEFDRDMALIPEVQTQNIIDLVTESVEQEPMWVTATLYEDEYSRRFLRDYASGTVHLTDIVVPDPEVDETCKELDGLDRRARADLARRVEAILDDRVRLVRDVGGQPESEWFIEFAGGSTGDRLLDFLSQVLHVPIAQSQTTEARLRTQLRLLRLHAAIAQFRWRNVRLPSSLDELRQPEYVADPLSQKPFLYRRLAGDTYELYSEGVRQTGRIDLRYVRQAPEPEWPSPP